jgi:hypothetical protein
LPESCRQIEEGSFTKADKNKSSSEVLMLCEKSIFLVKVMGMGIT